MNAASSPTAPLDLDAAIIDRIADAIVYCDRDGVIARWNPAAERLFGFTRTEALGQNLDLIIPEHLRAGHWRGFNAAMTNGALRLQGRPTLTRALHRSGAALYVEMSFAVVVDATNAPIGSVAVARDAGERVAREKAQR